MMGSCRIVLHPLHHPHKVCQPKRKHVHIAQTLLPLYIRMSLFTTAKLKRWYKVATMPEHRYSRKLFVQEWNVNPRRGR